MQKEGKKDRAKERKSAILRINLDNYSHQTKWRAIKTANCQIHF